MNSDFYIEIILYLRYYTRQIFAESYPDDIIWLIIMLSYVPIKIKSGFKHTVALINGRLYSWEYKFDDKSIGCCQYRMINSPHHIPLRNVKSIACGAHYTLALTDFFEVYVWGKKIFGKLIDFPQKIALSNIDKIACGKSHNIAIIRNSNSIYTWGKNTYGQLGLGNYISQYLPQELKLSDVKKVSCGFNFTIALTKFGKCYGWGRNHFKQLGLDLGLNVSSPQELGLSDVISIKCGSSHAIALTFNNEIYGWGSNLYYQLCSNQIWKISSPKKILSDIKIISIGCGEYYTMALTNHSQVYIWGGKERNSNIVPLQISLSNIKSINCCKNHIFVITTNDEIYVGNPDYSGHSEDIKNLFALIKF